MSTKPEGTQASIDEIIDNSGVKRMSMAEVSAEVAVLYEKCGSIIDATVEVFKKYGIELEFADEYLTDHLKSKMAEEAESINMAKGVVRKNGLEVFKRVS